ncbi:hypothetical protein Aperf_G00000055594 [Anoplocephala perfoliata]
MDKVDESLEGKVTKSGTLQPQVKNLETAENTKKSLTKVDKTEQPLDGKVNESEESQTQTKGSEAAESAKESTDEPESNSSTEHSTSQSEEEDDEDVSEAEDMSTPEDASQAEGSNQDGTQELVNLNKNSSNVESPAADKDSKTEQAVAVNSKEELNLHSESSVDIEGDKNTQQEESDLNNTEGSICTEDENEPEEYEEGEEEEAPIINRRCHFGDSDEEISESDSCSDGAIQAASEGEAIDSKPAPPSMVGSDPPNVQDDNAKKEEVGKKRSNRRDPTFVPREGAFYLHDTRDESDNRSPENSPRPVRKPIRPGIDDTKWSHDLYKETEQLPRSTNEIISRYGYNIREQGLERAEDANSAPVQRRPNNYRGGGRHRLPGREQNTSKPPAKSVTFAEKDFPSLREAEHSKNRGHLRGLRNAPVHGPLKHYRRSGFTYSNGEGAKEFREAGGNSNSRRRFNNNDNGDPERADFRRNDREGPAMTVTVQNANFQRSGKRYSSNRPQQGVNQPRQVVQRGTQRPYSGPFRNPRGVPRNQRNKPVSKASKAPDVVEKGVPHDTVGSAGDSLPKSES